MECLSTLRQAENTFVYLLTEDLNGFAVDNELSILVGNIAIEDTMDGVVLEHVDHVLKVNEATPGIYGEEGSARCLLSMHFTSLPESPRIAGFWDKRISTRRSVLSLERRIRIIYGLHLAL